MNQYYIDDIPSMIAGMIDNRMRSITHKIHLCNLLTERTGSESSTMVDNIRDDIKKLQKEVENLYIEIDMTAWEEECEIINNFMEDHT